MPVNEVPDSRQRVTLSIRPEVIRLDDETAAVRLPATVETTEFMGDSYRVHCDWQGHPLHVKTAASEAPSGRVTLGFDPSDVTILEDG